MFFPRCLAGLAAAALAGCASVPLSSLAALRRVDFMTTDFTSLRVAIQLPDAIRMQPGGVRMVAAVSYETLGPEGGVSRKETLHLREEAGVPSGLPESRSGFRTRVFRLDAGDVGRLNAMRAEIAAARADNLKGALGVGIEAKEFCRAGELGSDPVPITTLLLTVETKAFVPILKDFDLRSDAKINSALGSLPPCPDAP